MCNINCFVNNQNLETVRNELDIKWTIFSSVSGHNGSVRMIETGNYSNNQLNIYKNELYPNDHSGLNGRKFLVTSLAVR